MTIYGRIGGAFLHQFKVQGSVSSSSSTSLKRPKILYGNLGIAGIIYFKMRGSLPGGGIIVWDGANWIPKKVKAYDGATWNIKTLKYWNGASWSTTPY